MAKEKKDKNLFEYIDIEPEPFNPGLVPGINAEQIDQGISIQI